MKNFKYLYILPLILFAACSDDFSVPSNSPLDEEGNVSVNFSIPDMNVVSTRSADEWSIGSFQMVVADGNIVKQVTDFDLSDLVSTGTNKYKLRFQLLDDVKNNNNLQFYFLANTNAGVTKGDAVSDLSGKTLTALPADGEKMVMSGVTNLTNISAGSDVVLYRNDAKVTLSGGKVDSDGKVTVNSAEKYAFNVYGTASASSIIAGADVTNPILANPSTISLPNALTAIPSEVYVHPTWNTGSNEFKSYIIVKAAYKNTDYYYRLDFQEKKTVNGKIAAQAIDIKPNHHYQVIITGVFGAGYSSPTEAAMNPTPMVEYVIHDHAPVVYNMTTDGIRELGVSHEVVKNNNNDAYLFVKTYSPIAGEEVQNLIKVESGDPWVSFTFEGEASETEMGGNVEDNNLGAGNTKGTVFKYKATFDNSKTRPGTVEGKVKVSWKDLSRDVTVRWVREFDGAMLCDVKFKVKKQTFNNTGALQNEEIQWIDGENYWNFLKDQAYGVGIKENNGEVRNAGLHFPVMYGSGNVKWAYEYEVTIKDDVCPDGTAWDVEVDNSSRANFNLSIEKKSGKTFTVKRISPNIFNDWNYAVGKLNIIVGDIPYQLDLYHTGFFHKDSQSHRVDTQDSNHYYYYEVVSAGEKHWLDRNLGAKSAEYYIDGVPAYNPNRDAAGGYYRVASYKQYGEPQMYSDLCPPGYAIPTQSDWDQLRKDAGFSTALNGSNYDALYRSSDKTIYFPKAQYKEETSSALVGDARCGYYWTSTPFTGTEKEEVGNWLKSIVFSGNSTSTLSAMVEGKGGKKGYAMAVRCVSESAAGASTYVTRLNVKGATHVYLYTEKDGVRTPTTTWPGHPIGTYETVDKNYFSFSYQSQSISSSELYVIFNYLDSNGVVHTISNDVMGSGVTPTTINPKKAHGWKVNGATYQNLFDPAHPDKAGNDPTKNNYYWLCKNVNSDNPTTYCYKGDPDGSAQGGEIGGGSIKKYRIIWPKEYGQIWRYDIYFYDSTPSYLNGWKKNNDNYGNEQYYYFESQLDPETGQEIPPVLNFDICSDTNWANKRSFRGISSFGYNSNTQYYEYRIDKF